MADSTESTELVIPHVIVGLGNPGKKYDRTRHNVGFDAVDRLAKTWNIPLSENKKYQGEFGEGLAPYGGKVRLLKPLTYMNRSGQSIRSVVDWFKIEPGSVLMIYDDMDLPVGRIRLRLSGSAGGHNGMKSAIAHLGTQEFPRLRIGIGNPDDGSSNNPGDPVVSHVLGKFAPKEAKAIDEVMEWVLSAVEMSLKQGFEKAMNLYNGRSLDL